MTSKGVCCLAQQVFNAEQYYATSQISLQVPKMVYGMKVLMTDK